MDGKNPFDAPQSQPTDPTRRLAGPIRCLVGLLFYIAAVLPSLSIVAWIIGTIRYQGRGNMSPFDLAILAVNCLSVPALVWLGRLVRTKKQSYP